MTVPSQGPAVPLRVFVLLERGRGLTTWRRRYEARSVYDSTPYDYGSAEGPDCHIVLGEDLPEGPARAFVRKGVQRILGFNLVDALRQWPVLRQADVVWTHMESEHLALGVLKGLRFPVPPVIGQSVWLVDRWATTDRFHRWLFRWSLRQLEILTTHSELNARVLSDLTGKPVQVVPYGVPDEPWASVVPDTAASTRTRVLCLGNDEHRDWEVVRAVAALSTDTLEFRVLTRRVTQEFFGSSSNVRVEVATTVDETGAAYAWADVVCLPLRSNLHASGITVLLEAAAWSVPTVVTDTGGLRGFFGVDELTFVAPGSPASDWVAGIAEAVTRPRAEESVRAMRSAVRHHGLTGAGYARRHVQISRALLGRADGG